MSSEQEQYVYFSNNLNMRGNKTQNEASSTNNSGYNKNSRGQSIATSQNQS